jgi:methionine synthase II (cobalamin-independent)
MIVLAQTIRWPIHNSRREVEMITGIGSFPFTDADEAIDLIFRTSAKIPFWPQLPQRSHLENMFTTFLEGVPCVVADDATGSVYVDTGRTEGIERFYENFFAGNIEALGISRKVAPGFYRFLERLGEIKDDVVRIKGQLTGPFSMGLGLRDETGKAVIYNPAFFDIVKKALHLKARWMISMMRDALPDKEIIIFFDEPHMVSFGSAYVSISREDAILLFNEVFTGIGARRGVHCCGNTDWSVLFNTVVDIVNYDAFNFLDTIFYYPEDLKRFIGRGGWMAPGFVPSSDEVLTFSEDQVLGLLRKYRTGMLRTGIENAGEPLITTSCGVGSLRVEVARRAMELLSAFEGSPV